MDIVFYAMKRKDDYRNMDKTIKAVVGISRRQTHVVKPL